MVWYKAEVWSWVICNLENKNYVMCDLAKSITFIVVNVPSSRWSCTITNLVVNFVLPQPVEQKMLNEVDNETIELSNATDVLVTWKN